MTTFKAVLSFCIVACAFAQGFPPYNRQVSRKEPFLLFIIWFSGRSLCLAKIRADGAGEMRCGCPRNAANYIGASSRLTIKVKELSCVDSGLIFVQMWDGIPLSQFCNNNFTDLSLWRINYEVAPLLLWNILTASCGASCGVASHIKLMIVVLRSIANFRWSEYNTNIIDWWSYWEVYHYYHWRWWSDCYSCCEDGATPTTHLLMRRMNVE